VVAKHRNPFSKKTFSMERLEDRQMMAADVGAYMQGGDLHLYDAASGGGPNAVEISQVSQNVVRVTGIPAQGGGTSRINGQTSQDFYVPGSLYVKFGRGHDTVIVGQNATTSFNEIHIDVAATPPVLTASKAATTSKVGGVVAVPQYYGPDNDIVSLQNVRTQGYTEIYMGVGNDQYSMTNGIIGQAGENFFLNTGAGADTVDIDLSAFHAHLTVYTYSSLNETDADTVNMEWAAAARNVQVYTGGGADTFNMAEAFAGEDIQLDSGAGNDTLHLNSLRAIDDVFAQLGAGDDKAIVQYLRADEASFDGGAGIDRFDKFYDGPLRKLNLTNFEYINGKKVFTKSPYAVPQGTLTVASR
jgi:hypothetical protein